jgi:hypothetical protein
MKLRDQTALEIMKAHEGKINNLAVYKALAEKLGGEPGVYERQRFLSKLRIANGLPVPPKGGFQQTAKPAEQKVAKKKVVAKPTTALAVRKKAPVAFRKVAPMTGAEYRKAQMSNRDLQIEVGVIQKRIAEVAQKANFKTAYFVYDRATGSVFVEANPVEPRPMHFLLSV